jgi:hypothetical protein
MITIGMLAAKSARADCFDVGGTEVCNNMNVTPPNTNPEPPQPSIPPCYLEQNAMRPCTFGKVQSPHVQKVTGVDPNIAGTWTYRRPNGSWVLEVSKDGTYKFHSEAGDGAPSHLGSFGAMHEHWSLTANSGYPGWVDGGTYILKLPDTWILTGRLGRGVWHREPTRIDSSAAAPASRSGTTWPDATIRMAVDHIVSLNK